MLMHDKIIILGCWFEMRWSTGGRVLFSAKIAEKEAFNHRISKHRVYRNSLIHGLHPPPSTWDEL
jgi:hypothetical protein